MSDQASVVSELYRRLDTLPADKQAVVRELAGRLGIASPEATAPPYPKAPNIITNPLARDMSQEKYDAFVQNLKVSFSDEKAATFGVLSALASMAIPGSGPAMNVVRGLAAGGGTLAGRAATGDQPGVLDSAITMGLTAGVPMAQAAGSLAGSAVRAVTANPEVQQLAKTAAGNMVGVVSPRMRNAIKLGLDAVKIGKALSSQEAAPATTAAVDTASAETPTLAPKPVSPTPVPEPAVPAEQSAPKPKPRGARAARATAAKPQQPQADTLAKQLADEMLRSGTVEPSMVNRSGKVIEIPFSGEMNPAEYVSDDANALGYWRSRQQQAPAQTQADDIAQQMSPNVRRTVKRKARK